MLHNVRRIPIRYKILITLLLVVTVVVSIITFTMANLFHKDKTAYIRDLASFTALHTAEEARSLLTAYRERLHAFTGIAYEGNLNQAQKAGLLKQLFEDLQDVVAITISEEGMKPVTVYDTKGLGAAGLTTADLSRFRAAHPLPRQETGPDGMFIENSSLSGKLLTFTLTSSHLPQGARKRVVVEAVIRLTGLLRVVSGSDVFEAFIVDSRGILLVHRDHQRVARREVVDWIPKIESIEKKQSVSAAVEYTHEGTALVAGFSRVETGNLVVGVQIPREAAYLTGRELLADLIVVALALLILAALLSNFWSYRITRPIERLSDAAKVVGKGHFDVRVERSSQDEIGDLAESFNQMTSELDRRERELEETQAALVQSEKMAAFGQLGAGIAHEVKNPLAGILGFAQLSLRKAEKDSPLYKNLEVIEKETKRCKNIIENLLKFARQEQVSFQPTDLNQVVDDAVAIVGHQLGIHQVNVVKVLAPGLPAIMGNANQIQQVIMNLLINAEQAMDGKPGEVRVTTQLRSEGQIEVRVADTGPGIPKEIQSRLFEPFFTTKPAGRGTGLGLSVSYGIIKDHKGEIFVQSEPGKGAEFIILFPPAPRTPADGTSPADAKQTERHEGA
jgi:signal transduction histidine kinase